MNDIFASYLRKFVLVFYDDILVYSKGLKDHVIHLSKVLALLRKNQLFAKRSKCFFGQTQVEYLGHIISQEGVATDPSKIEAMVNWPTPTSIKGLRGFLVRILQEIHQGVWRNKQTSKISVEEGQL